MAVALSIFTHCPSVSTPRARHLYAVVVLMQLPGDGGREADLIGYIMPMTEISGYLQFVPSTSHPASKIIPQLDSYASKKLLL